MNRKCILIADDESANIQSLAQALGDYITKPLSPVEADLTALLQAADVLLYQAKQQSRNRCCARAANGEITQVLPRQHVQHQQVFASKLGLGERS